MPNRFRHILLALAIGAQLCLTPAQTAQAQSLTRPLGAIDSSEGFIVDGESPGDEAARSVSVVGDINADGIDDLLIGAPGSDADGASAGRAYVIFGRTGGQPSPLQLGDLDGSRGFVIKAALPGDLAGFAVAAAGDINSDGIDDLLIGAHAASPNGQFSGSAYVVFGRSTGFSASLLLGELNGTTGFAMHGAAGLDFTGSAVSGAGDLNGDGIDDVIVGAPGNQNKRGLAYVVFGRSSGFTSPLQLSALNGSNGFILEGENIGSRFGISVAGAGDTNGDGIGDLLVGSPGFGQDRPGAAYVVRGRRSGFPRLIRVSALSGSAQGITGLLFGTLDADFANLGASVALAGDVNGDGRRELLIGANTFEGTGRAFVVFGPASGFASNFRLRDLNGNNGFSLVGEARGDAFGAAVGNAGDFNGDGLDDLLIGAYGAQPNGRLSGRAYLVFGRSNGFPAALQAASLDGTRGYAFDAEAAGDLAGLSVSGAGDLNGDGIDDLVIGALNATGAAATAGRAYVIYGGEGALPDAPTIGIASAADGQASVRFTPSAEGGSPVFTYAAISSPDGRRSVGCTTSPCMVTGLSNGRAYTFTVRAISSLGSSLPSQPSNSVVPLTNQTIAFGPNPGPLVFAGGPAAVSAVASSGLPVRYASATASVCSVDAESGALGLLAAGTCTVTADQDGNAGVNPAPQALQDVLIERAAQTIQIKPQPALGIGETRVLAITGGASGNPVELTSQTPGICAVSGLSVNGLGEGGCRLLASQLGNDNFNAASPVEISFDMIDRDAIFSSGFEPTP
jgi:hypothetical protein